MKKYLLPTLMIILLTPFTPWLDIKISSFFYSNDSFWDNSILQFFCKYLIYPSHLMAVMSFIMIIFVRDKTWRKIALCFFLTFIIGELVVVNGIFKGLWGRPRPVQIYRFGGFADFLPFYVPNFGLHLDRPMRSFPSGHAAAGFVFFSLCVSGFYYGKKILFYLSLFLTIALGTTLSFTRIAQGKHFFSDVIMSAFIMWMTSLIVNKYVRRK